jgi:hypothetical protein
VKGRNPGSVRFGHARPLDSVMVVNVTWAEFNLLLGGIGYAWDWRENEDGMVKVFEPQVIKFIRAEEFPMLVPHDTDSFSALHAAKGVKRIELKK